MFFTRYLKPTLTKTHVLEASYFLRMYGKDKNFLVFDMILKSK